MDMDAERNLRAYGKKDGTLLGDITADNFRDDPINLWTLGSTGALGTVFRTLAKAIYAPNGFGNITLGGEGCTMWLPPGGSKHLALLPTARLAASVWRHGGMAAVKRTIGLGEFMDRNKPKEPHYYLFVIAVRQAHQGQGWGGRLIDAGLARADAESLPAYLENTKERNLGFYESRGFRVMEKVYPAEGAPPMWLMWREPKT